MNNLNIGLSPWIIADGNYKYSEFECGKTVDFALEFYAPAIQLTQNKQKSIYPLGDSLYKVNAEVIYYSPKAWVLDFGILAYRESPPSGFGIGHFVESDLYLGIDPFFYFEQLWKLPEMRPLIYTWRVENTIKKTAPYIQRDNNYYLEPDKSKYSYEEVDFTKPRRRLTEEEQVEAFQKMSLEFILNCTRIDAEPKFQRG